MSVFAVGALSTTILRYIPPRWKKAAAAGTRYIFVFPLFAEGKPKELGHSVYLAEVRGAGMRMIDSSLLTYVLPVSIPS